MQQFITTKIPGGYRVAHADDPKIFFAVTRPNGKMLCSCPDFKTAPLGTCDHIAEVIARHQQSGGQRSLARVPAIPEIRKTATAWLLEHPFRVDQIKVKDGVKYIDGASVIQRLNDVLGTANWSFKIVGEPIQLQDEVIVRGRLTAWIGDRKVVKEDFGAHEYARKKSDKSIISRSDTIKSATTDCIKR